MAKLNCRIIIVSAIFLAEAIIGKHLLEQQITLNTLPAMHSLLHFL